MYRVNVEFTSPRGKLFPIFSWVIRAVEGTPYSHVRLRWTSTSGEELIYEASGSSVHLVGAYARENYQVDIHHSYGFDLTREQYRTMIKLFRFAGVKYGTLQIVGIGLAKLFRLKKNPFSSGRYSQVCSELVAMFLKEVLGKKIGQSLDTATPKDIKEFIDKTCNPT